MERRDSNARRKCKDRVEAIQFKEQMKLLHKADMETTSYSFLCYHTGALNTGVD